MTVKIKSLAQLKRALNVGVSVKMLSHDWYPDLELVGSVRTIEIKQSNAIAFKSLNGTSPSWLYLESAKEFEFDGTNRFKVRLNDVNEEVGEYVTYEILGENNG